MIDVIKQMVEALEWCHGGEPVGTADAIQAGRQAIAELESQEPVGWVQDVEFEQLPEFAFSWVKTKLHDKPLFTHPPQRTWVGLTDEEVRQMCGSVPSMKEAVREAEAKLKELNG